MGLEMQDVAAWAREGLSFAIPLFQSLSSVDLHRRAMEERL